MSTATASEKYLGTTDEALIQLYRMAKLVSRLYVSLDRIQERDERGLLTIEKCGELMNVVNTELRAAEKHLTEARTRMATVDGDGSFSHAERRIPEHRQREAGALVERTGGLEDSPNAVVAFDSDGHKRRLGEILRKAGLITGEQLASALAEKQEFPHRRLGEILVERGYTGEDVIARMLANQLGIDFVELDKEKIERSAVRVVDSRLAMRHQCISIRRTLDYIFLAMANPFDLVAIEDVERVTGLTVIPLVSTARAISAAHARHAPHASRISGQRGIATLS